MYLLIDFVFFIVGLGLGGSVSFPKVADLESIYCQLLYSRDQTFVPLVETNTDEFLCTYKTHCFALCHCCEYDACDCEMTCPDNCTCYHDNSWSKNIAECSGKLIFSSTYSSNFCSLLILIQVIGRSLSYQSLIKVETNSCFNFWRTNLTGRKIVSSNTSFQKHMQAFSDCL